jgi:hypothetical protein
MRPLLVSILSTSVMAAAAQVGDADSVRMITAFYGIDDFLPIAVYCPGAGAVDGLVVVFSHKLDEGTLEPGDFVVTALDGTTTTPACATLPPAAESNEARTVLLVGQFGTGVVNEPVSVEVVGDLFTLASTPSETATCSAPQNCFGLQNNSVIPLAEGPIISFASVLDAGEMQLGQPYVNGPPGNDIGAGCPVGTTQVVQVVWSGGVVPSMPGVADTTLRQFYTVWVDDGGTPVPALPFALADLDDNDNYHDLCLTTALPPIEVTFEAGEVEDPNGDLNPFTACPVTYCQEVNTGISAPEEDLVGLLPNPASGEVHVGISGNGHYDVQVLASNGMLCLARQGQGPLVLDVEQLPPGIYAVRLSTAGRMQCFKLAISR